MVVVFIIVGFDAVGKWKLLIFYQLSTLGVLIFAGTNFRKLFFILNVLSEILCFWPIKF